MYCFENCHCVPMEFDKMYTESPDPTDGPEGESTWREEVGKDRIGG